MSTYEIDTTITRILSKTMRMIHATCGAAAGLSLFVGFGLLGNVDNGSADIYQTGPMIVAALGACVLFALLTVALGKLREVLGE